MSYTRPARAFHDLNNVTTLVITGWRGSHEVKPHAAGDRGVAIIAPRRDPDEFWTFQRTTSDGELHCFSSLTGSPSLLTDPGESLVVLMPADRIGGIAVRFEALPETASEERGAMTSAEHNDPRNPGFPMVPAGQIEGDVAADVRRLTQPSPCGGHSSARPDSFPCVRPTGHHGSHQDRTGYWWVESGVQLDSRFT